MVQSKNTEAVVEAIGLTKVFKDFWNRPKARAVNGISFTVRKGQVFGLLGPNGSGKSTTVKMILGLLYPTRGTLRVFGESPENVDMKRRIGYLPEETYLYKYLTAAETLDFFGALFGLSGTERERRSKELLEMVGLANSYNRPVGEFSKGMARRIGVAQALVNNPDLVILDEPTSGLDPIGCREVKDVIRHLAKLGKTVILCSHLLADVQDVCDEVLVLYGGKVRTEGSLESILAVEDRTRIISPRLDEALLEEIRGVLRRHSVDDAELSIDHPKRNLEEFFLEVVRNARAESVETAGAQAGGAIAPYLAGAEGKSPAAVLAALSGAGAEAEAAAAAAAEKAAEPEKKPEPKVDAARLASLTDAAEVRAAAAKEKAEVEQAEEKQAAEAAGRKEASKKLEGLLGGDGN